MGCRVTACREIMMIVRYGVERCSGQWFECRWPRIKGGGRKNSWRSSRVSEILIGYWTIALDMRL
jgi:hypothetical protein